MEALERELKDVRTWETQYQMIMALAECNYTPAAAMISTLAQTRFEATMVLVAVGDAYVRLRRTSDSDPIPVFEILAINSESLLEGALRAIAMLRMQFMPEATASIIEQVVASNSERLLFWLAAACPGWSGHAVDEFLNRCEISTREDVRDAAMAARVHKYKKWSPL